jgi:ATP-dependent protease ClpP protease subunit
MDTMFETELQNFLAEQRRTREAMAKRVEPVEDRRWFRIENAVAAEAELWIFDDIGYDWMTGTGVSSSQFAEELKTITAKSILLHLNSGGGNLFEGLAIYASLKNHPASVTVQIEGSAASAASIIAMAGDRVLMSRGSMMMIHEPSGISMGPASVHAKTAEFLNKVADNMASLYADRAGKRINWRARMQAETWYSDQEAVDAGLADEVLKTPAVTAGIDFGAYGYANLPESLQPAKMGAEAERVVQNITINNNYGGVESPPLPDPEPQPKPEEPDPSQDPSEGTEEMVFSVVSARLLIDLAEAEVAAIA